MIFGDGEQTRDFTYVANAVAANLAAMRHPEPLDGEVFNVGTGRRIRLLDLVDALNRDLRHRPRARVPAPAARRRPRLAGQPRADRPGPRLSAARPLRGGAEADRRGGPMIGRPFASRTLDQPAGTGAAIETLPPGAAGK